MLVERVDGTEYSVDDNAGYAFALDDFALLANLGFVDVVDEIAVDWDTA